MYFLIGFLAGVLNPLMYREMVLRYIKAYPSKHERGNLVAGENKNDQFSAECSLPDPARKAMLAC
jgi:hypothetical protein